MEEVLEVYNQSYDPHRPWICMDEVSNQLVGETRRPLPAEPGQALSDEYEYQRNSMCNLFMFFDPLWAGGMSKLLSGVRG
jgi:hypothetical protein